MKDQGYSYNSEPFKSITFGKIYTNKEKLNASSRISTFL